MRVQWTVIGAIALAMSWGCSDATTAPADGVLDVTIAGLPDGTAAAVTVTGPAAFSRTLHATTTLHALVRGSYTVAAVTVPVGDSEFVPTPASQQLTVSGSTPATATVGYAALGAIAVQVLPVATGLQSPVFLTAPVGDERLFIVEQPGRIRIVQGGSVLPTPFLDISAKVQYNGERGMLSMAFHPGFATNRLFFVYYVNHDGDIQIARYAASADAPNVADTAGTVILTIAHRDYPNHNGGLLAFGLDGMLYAGIGDGGGDGNPLQTGQSTNTLLGKLLRLDVDHGDPYMIPADNPFAGQDGKRGEIWAYGLRNPWRYAFDQVTDRLYIADVGQDLWEEVDVESVTAGGLNYGWNRMEGLHCYAASSCDQSGLTLPVLEYGHDQGCSIIGGYVYRGSQIPGLVGRYVYSDFCSGGLHSMFLDGSAVSESRALSIDDVGNVQSFGQDAAGELYLLSGNGTVYRIAPR